VKKARSQYPDRGDDTPTVRDSDWTGAEVLRGGERHAQPVSLLLFHVYRASDDDDVFVIADHGDASRLPSCPAGTWQPFRILPETGKPRIGFSEQEAKRDIARQGHHLIRVQARAHAKGA
jgi:hypothetical protein